MERGLRAFAWALAFVGGLIVVFSLADLIVTNMPFDPGRIEWRYQIIGRLSQMVITVIFGLTFILGAAVIARRSAGARAVGVFAYLAAVALLALTVLFVAESSEASAMVPETAQSIFRLGGVRAIVKNVLAAGGLAVLGWAAMVNARIFSEQASRTKSRDQLITE